MGKVAKKISLSARVLMLMQQELTRKKIERHYYHRIQIILKSSQGMHSKEIASLLGCDVKTVSQWRNRWDFTPDVSNAFEQGEDGRGIRDKVLLNKIKSILSDKPRPGHSSNLSDSDIIRLQALACENPENYGLPFSSWTHIELSKQAKRMGIQISPSWYGVILKKQIKST